MEKGDPFRKLAERGYRGRPELEAVDRKLAEQYAKEHQSIQAEKQRGRWAKLDQTTKLLVGIGSLMLLFFLCLWITDALRVHHARRAVEDAGAYMRQEMQRLLPR